MKTVDEAARFGEFITRDPRLAETVARLGEVAASGRGVLLVGEPGTGKRLIASEIHRASGRAGKLVCVEVPDYASRATFSRLFGHVDVPLAGMGPPHPGACVEAAGGTLYVHEVDFLSGSAQRALQDAVVDGSVVPLGGNAAVQVDLRLVAGTTEPMSMIGDFGERLRSCLERVELPPLRGRPADVSLLARAVLARIAPGKVLTDAATAVLVDYDWPFNVDELEHIIAAAVRVSGPTGPLDASSLRFEPKFHGPGPGGTETMVVPLDVYELARRGLYDGIMPTPAELRDGASPESRQRAAFLFLRLERPDARWSAHLTRQYQQLFFDGWDLVDEHRNYYELARLLELDQNGDDLLDWIEHAERAQAD